MQSWASANGTTLTIAASEGGQFYIGGGPGTRLDGAPCALQVAGRIAPVHLYRLVSGSGADTAFVATVDIPVQQHAWLGAGVRSATEAGRMEALASIATLTVFP